jgi:nucleotide-binding universal stress UspA family protein
VLAFSVSDAAEGGRAITAEGEQLKQVRAQYEAECAKASALGRAKEVSFVAVPRRGERGSTGQHIARFCDESAIDVLMLGSIELADPTKGLYLGSVAAACAKMASETNVCVVKNFA